MDQKQVLERWLRQLKKDEISPDAVGLGHDKEQALRYIREELEKIEAMEKKQTSPNP
jgi:low affinity Fe/Cu permease